MTDNASRPTAVPFPAPAAPPPIIFIANRQLRDLLDAGWSALAAINARAPTLFANDDIPVRISCGPSPARIEPLSAAALREALARAATWKYSQEKPSNVAPPRELARMMLATPSPRCPLPQLTAVVHAPVIGTSGAVITAPGYHPADQVWCAPAPDLHVPPIHAPTRQDLDAAKKWILDDLLPDFAFVTQADRAHAVALLLLPVVRLLIPGPAPLHGIEAATPGAGKGLLADLVSLIHRGHGCPGTTLGRDDMELTRTLTSILLRGDTIILLDNITNLDSQVLAAALTLPVWQDRILGQSKTTYIPMRATWVCTGNNPTMSKEIARRYIRIRIDPGVEHPEDRPPDAFKHHPLPKWVKANRSVLLHSLLVLARAWIDVGRPPGRHNLGSFEEWAEVIGGILDHADIPGFLDNREDHLPDDETVRHTSFTAAWHRAHGEQWVATSELVALAVEHGVIDDAGPRPSATRLGGILKRQRDAVWGGLRIERRLDAHTKANRYRVVPFDRGTSDPSAGPSDTEVPQ